MNFIKQKLIAFTLFFTDEEKAEKIANSLKNVDIKTNIYFKGENEILLSINFDIFNRFTLNDLRNIILGIGYFDKFFVGIQLNTDNLDILYKYLKNNNINNIYLENIKNIEFTLKNLIDMIIEDDGNNLFKNIL